jgi:hypothetical protein
MYFFSRDNYDPPTGHTKSDCAAATTWRRAGGICISERKSAGTVKHDFITGKWADGTRNMHPFGMAIRNLNCVIQTDGSDRGKRDGRRFWG